jgi:hypothetical protein
MVALTAGARGIRQAAAAGKALIGVDAPTRVRALIRVDLGTRAGGAGRRQD